MTPSRRHNRSRLAVERLEARDCPALAASFSGGSLSLSGVPLGELDIVHTGSIASTFHVTDGGRNLGTYTLSSNLTVTLMNRPADIKINLNGGRIPGSVTIDLGNGYIGSKPPGQFSVDLYDNNATPSGTIFGSVTIRRGNPQETLNVGAFRDPVGLTTTPDPITIRGGLTIAAARASSGQGVALDLAAGTTVFGSVSTTLVAQAAIGSATTGSPLTHVGGDLSINNSGNGRRLQFADFGTVSGNLNVTGTQLDDSIALQQASPGGGMVGKNLIINTGDGLSNGDQVLLGPNTLVSGSATITSGGNSNTTTGDQISVLGEVDHDLTINMGDNMNSLYFAPQNVGDPTPFVGGNMTVTAGNGTNNIGIGTAGNPGQTGPFAGRVNQTLTFTLGAGDNGSSLFPMVIAPDLSTGTGIINWTSGNGQDFLQLGASTTLGIADFSPVVNIVFGNQDDTFILDIGPTGLLSGLVDGGGRVVQNTLTILSGNSSPSNFMNFP
jgi:hypothetical protein